MLCGTLTYPLAVRFVKRVFKLRGFYSIHLAIAPILALIHINIFGISHTYFRIKHMEREYDAFLAKNGKSNQEEYFNYSEVKRLIDNETKKSPDL